MSKPKLQWAWAQHMDDEVWQGPFDTREEAEACGRSDGDPDIGLGFVAPCAYPDPAVYVMAAVEGDGDIGEVLNRMDESAGDNGCFAGDDELFEASEGAEEALQLALEAWAEKYVTASKFSVQSDEAEPVRPQQEAAND